MACDNEQSSGLTCVPSAIPVAQRAQHFVLARKLLNQQAAERADLADGYGFRFEAGTLKELMQFIDNERKCCPFMQFELLISPDSGPLWLRMTGPDGTRAVLDAELSLGGNCGCTK